MRNFEELHLELNADEIVPGAKWNKKWQLEKGLPYVIGIDDFVLEDGLNIDVKIKAGYDHEFMVEGEIETVYKSKCARCLNESVEKLHVDFSDKFVLNMDADVEYDEEKEAYTYRNSKLDFNPLILDNIILSLPIRVLCREDCKGICTGCGVDLNNMQCRCSDEERPGQDDGNIATHRPFADLLNLNSDMNEEV